MNNIDRNKILIRYMVDNQIIESQKDLGKKMGYTNESSFSQVINGKVKMPKEFIPKLKTFIPDLNEEWLMEGKGDMLKENKSTEVHIPESGGITIETLDKYNKAKELGIPLLPEVNFKFAAGQTQLLNGSENITRYWFLPDCRDCEGVAQVVGRSMSPTLPSGSWVTLKRLPLPVDNPNTIPFGNIFGVVVEDKYTGEYHGHIKILRRYKDKDLSRKYWIAHSINEDEFDDFDIEISQVRSLWIVKQHIVSDIL